MGSDSLVIAQRFQFQLFAINRFDFVNNVISLKSLFEYLLLVFKKNHVKIKMKFNFIIIVSTMAGNAFPAAL